MARRLLALARLAGALALTSGLSACGATGQPRRQTFQYSNLIVIRAESWEVDQACARVDTRNDEGRNISRRIRCCFDPQRRQMWVSWEDVDCIPHELCHVDGQPKESCRRMHWE